jgi:hypothetical protein
MAENCPFEIQPYKQTNIPNRPSPVNLNYTNQDFWSMKSRLVSFIRDKFGSDFNDFVESSLAVMLIENWAFIADTLSFKIDQIANEVFIDTVTEIENAFRLAKLVGMVPQPPIASKSMWTARINTPQLIDLEIPTPFDVEIVNNDQLINIELFPADIYNRPIYDQNIIISAGTIVNSNIVGVEGQTFIEDFIGSGEINQSFLLKFRPVLLDSVRVQVDGQNWDQVEYFTDSQPRKEYRLEYNSDYSAFIVFGNNRAGISPPNGSIVTCTYRIGGGTIGNIVTNFASVDTLVTIEGQAFTVPVNLTNYTRGEFGYDGDNVEDIRRKLPIYNRSQNRAVTGADYKSLADLFVTPYNGVMGKATVSLRHAGCAANILDIFVLTKNGVDGLQPASTQFKAEFIEYMDAKKMLTDNICVKDGLIINTTVSIDVVLDKYYRTFEDSIKAKIERNLTIFFNLQNWDYGQSLRDTDIIKALSTITEPYRYEVTLTTDDPNNSGRIVAARYYEIIRPEATVIQFNYE